MGILGPDVGMGIGPLAEALGYYNQARSLNEAQTLGADPKSLLAALMGLAQRDQQDKQLESQDFIANRRAMSDQNVAQIGANLGYAKLPVEHDIARTKVQGELAQQAAAAQNAMAIQNNKQAFEASTVPAGMSAQLQSHEKIAQSKVEAEAQQNAITNQLKMLGYRQKDEHHADTIGLGKQRLEQSGQQNRIGLMEKMSEAGRAVDPGMQALILRAQQDPQFMSQVNMLLEKYKTLPAVVEALQKAGWKVQ